jgi:hypothetical protein
MVYFAGMDQEGVLLEEEKEFKRFYKLSLWWVEHRASLRRLGIGLIAAFDVVLLLFVAWVAIDTYAISFDAERRVVAEAVAFGQSDLHAYTLANAADDLEVTQEKVFSIGEGRYDLFAMLLNSNDDWWATITYHFTTDEGDSEITTGFILPSEEKPIVDIAFESDSNVSDAELVLDSVDWHRVDHHMIHDYQAWEDDRLNLLVDSASFSKQTEFENDIFGRASFQLTNSTAFSYYEPRFFILLMKGSNVVGVNRTSLSDFESREEVKVDLNWFGTLPSVTNIEVVPEINLFDLDSYKALDGETTRDTRTRVLGR